MVTRAVVLRERSRGARSRRGSTVGAVVALVVALACGLVVVNSLADPSLSLRGILTVVVAAVAGVAALTVSAVVFVAGFQRDTIRR